MADFWLHENPTGDRARVHRSSCGDCNDGKGKKSGSGEANGKWVPFDSHDDAAAAAERLGIKDSGDCGSCPPDSGGKSW